jgi:uncharacterized protein
MKLQTFVFILLLIISPCIYGQKTAERRQPIIDMHMHAYPAGFDLLKSVNSITGRLSAYKNGAGHRRAVIGEMKRLNMVKGVFYVSDGSPDEIAAWQKEAPGLIVPSPRNVSRNE